MGNPTAKRCLKCGETKPLEEFGRHRANPDGLEYHCKECRREAQRLYRAANLETARESVRRWREANREAEREAMRRRRTADPEATREQGRRAYAANPEARRESSRRYYAANAEAERESDRQYRAANRQTVLDHYGHACACCGAAENLEIDHVNGDGGAHRAEIGGSSPVMHRWLIANGFPDGFQVLCKSCNSSKQDGERCRLNHLAGDGR